MLAFPFGPRAHRVVLVAAVAALSTACSLLLESKPQQCATDGDCRAVVGEGGVCSARKVCVAASAQDDGGNPGTNDGGPPSDAGGTPDALASTDAGKDVAVVPACSNAACSSEAGAPSICDRATGACVGLLSQDCQKVVGPTDDDNVIILGSLAALSGASQATGVQRANAVDLAISEIGQTIVGLPGGAGGRPRPLAFVSCNDQDNNERAARHLVDTLKVPVVIGAANSGNTINVAQKVTIPGGALLISPSATSPAITGLADNGLLWRTAPTDALQGVPLRRLIGDQETALKTARGLAKVKVAIVYKNDAYGTGLFATATQGLALNGEAITATGNAGFFFQYQYDAAGDASAIVADIAAKLPQIIVIAGTSESIDKIVKAVEGAWPATGSPPPRPEYIFSDGLRQPALLTAVDTKDELRLRMRGTVPGRAGWAPATGFTIRYRGKFASDPTGFGAAGAYDATYLAAYSMVVAGSKPLTGTVVAEGIGKLVGGAKLEVGPAQLNDAFQALRAGGSIDFEGASGPLNFDLATGEAPLDIDVWCMTKDGQNKPVFASTGLYFDAASTTMKGAFACP